jgi:hypothetical protein
VADVRGDGERGVDLQRTAKTAQAPLESMKHALQRRSGPRQTGSIHRL